MTDIEKQAREEFERYLYTLAIFPAFQPETMTVAEKAYLAGYMKGVEREKKLRECVELFLEDYDKKEFTYGWQDLMARKFRQCLAELDGSE